MDERMLAEAAQGSLTLAKSFRAVLAVGEVLEEVVDLGNLRRERQMAAEHWRQTLEDLRAEAASLGEQVLVSRDAIAQHQEEGRAAVEGGRQAAEAIIAAASENASQVIAQAESEVDRVRGELERERELIEADVRDLRAEKADLEARVDELKGEMAELRRRLGWEAT